MLQNKLREYRKKSHFTQQDLAEHLNVTRQTISKWEYGMAIPDAQRLSQIADILNVEVSELLGEEVDSLNNYSRNQNEVSATEGTSYCDNKGTNQAKGESDEGDMRSQLGDLVEPNPLKKDDNIDWTKVARELEKYNFYASQRIELAKKSVKWVITLIILISLIILVYKVYEMHFYKVSDVSITPVVTEIPRTE